MKKTTLAATAAVLLASGAALTAMYPAFAQDGRDPMGDGTVTWAKAKERADMMWTRLDVNKDGVLNERDREAKMAQMFDGIDTNHDSAVSRAEFMEHHKAMMEGKGRDGAGPAMGHPHMGMMPGGMMKGFGGHKLQEMAEKADTNHDKTVSRAEFDGAAKARFDKADGNHDGQLTAAERRAAWAGMRKEHGGRGGHGRGHGMHGMHGGMGGAMGDMPPPPPPPGA